MSSESVDRAFHESRILSGLKQKPNWIGAVWGSCQTRGCRNYKRVGEYMGGFCKQCSTRHRYDHQKPVLVTLKRAGHKVEIPNPEIRWTNKIWVLDMSHTMTSMQRKAFYEEPKPDIY